MAGRMAVVDEQNHFVRWVERKELHEHYLPHRSVQVLVFTSDNKMVLQRRHPDKDTYPDYWDLAACGHVEESDYLGGPDERLDEVYLSVAGRELEEELGVNVELSQLAAFSPKENVHYEHFRLFRGESDGPFVLQAEEVVEARSVSREELDAMILDPEQKVTNTLIFLLNWLDEHQLWS
ncbi:MAG: NUDIX domain-containing protein [Planctomycetota bacterium]|nr:NUDIX domain-containing protein [Planctomycetota bacterium]